MRPNKRQGHPPETSPSAEAESIIEETTPKQIRPENSQFSAKIRYLSMVSSGLALIVPKVLGLTIAFTTATSRTASASERTGAPKQNFRTNRAATAPIKSLDRSSSQRPNPLDLSQALWETRLQASDPKILAFDVARINYEAKAIDAAYDWQLSSSISRSDDESPSQNSLAGESRKILQTNISLKKMLATGTAVEFGVEATSKDLTFASNSQSNSILRTSANVSKGDLRLLASPPSAGLQSQTELGGSRNPSINPEHTGRIRFTVSQPLLSNFNGRLIDLRRELINLKKTGPFFQKKSIIQLEQSKTEQLFWRLAALRARKKNAERLILLGEKFYKLIKKRQTIGRADQVDVASAGAQIVRHDGLKLNFDISTQLIKKQIYFQVFNNISSKTNSMKYQDFKISTPNLTTPPLSLPASNLEIAHQVALKNRYDLQRLKASLSSPRKELELILEEDSPTLNFFATISGNGLKSTTTDALQETFSTDHPSVTVGLKLTAILGRTRVANKKSVTGIRVMQTNARIHQKKRQIYKEIELTWLERQTGQQQNLQAQAHINSLKRQRRAEKNKYRQARSSEIGVLRYDMEIISAENDQISALEKIRIAEAKLRLYSHSYPEAI